MRMTRAVGIKCFLWVFWVAILIMVWSKKGRAYLEEHVYAQIAMSVIIYLLSGNHHAVLDKWKHIKIGMSRKVQTMFPFSGDGLLGLRQCRRSRIVSLEWVEVSLLKD